VVLKLAAGRHRIQVGLEPLLSAVAADEGAPAGWFGLQADELELAGRAQFVELDRQLGGGDGVGGERCGWLEVATTIAATEGADDSLAGRSQLPDQSAGTASHPTDPPGQAADQAVPLKPAEHPIGTASRRTRAGVAVGKVEALDLPGAEQAMGA